MTVKRWVLGAVVGGLSGVAGWFALERARSNAFEVPLVAPSPRQAHVPTPEWPAQSSSANAPSVTSTAGKDGAKAVGTGVIFGKVYLPDGDVAGGASLTVMPLHALDAGFQRDSAPRSTALESDSAGTFEAGELTWGWYAVMAESGANTALHCVRLSAVNPVAQVLIALEAGGPSPVAGGVQDEEGAPVVGAVVHPIAHNGVVFPTSIRPNYEARTEELGTFSTAPLPAGAWEFRVTAAGFAPRKIGPVIAGTQDIRVVLDHGGMAIGNITAAESGEPIAGISVSASLRDDTRSASAVKTDANGRFEFANLASAAYLFALTDETMVVVGDNRPVRVAPNATTDVGTLCVARGGVVTGRVFDADSSSGIPGATVILQAKSPDSLHRLSLSALSTLDGVYRIEGVSDGEYELRLSGVPGYPESRDLSRMPSVTARLGTAITGVDVPLRRGATLAGVVVDSAGHPLAHAMVRGAAETGSSYDVTNSGDDGAYELGGFRPGDWVRVYVRWLDIRTSPQGPYLIPPGGLKDVRIVVNTQGSTGGISGKVLHEDHQPFGYAAVSMLPAEENLYMSGDAVPSMFARNDGSFLLTGLLPGDYELWLGPAGPTGTIQPIVRADLVRVQAGQCRKGIVLIYRDSLPSISGCVVDERERPVADAEVSAEGPDGLGVSASTDMSGRYSLAKVSNRGNVVRVSARGYSQAVRTDVPGGARGIDFTLRAPRLLEGVVSDALTHEPIPEFYIGAAGEDEWRTYRDARGKFRVELEAGDHTLEIFANRYSTVRIQVSDGQDFSRINPVAVPLQPSP